MSLRLGIIGCGLVAQAHAEALAQTDAVLAWVCDVRRPAAEALAARYGACTADRPEQIVDAGVDGVIICTPPAYHGSAAQPFLDAGIAVLCEKPLAQDAAAAAELAAAAGMSAGIFMVALTQRFHGAIIELRRLVAAGVLGDILQMHNMFGGWVPVTESHRGSAAASGGGALIDNGIHSVDLFRSLVGEPVRVQAMAGNIAQNAAVEDLAMLNLMAAGPRFGQILSTYSLPACSNRIELYGTQGMATVNYGPGPLPPLSYRLADGSVQTVDCSQHPERRVGQMRAFLESIQTGKSAVPAGEGLAASLVIQAAYRSVAEGRTLDIQPATTGVEAV